MDEPGMVISSLRTRPGLRALVEQTQTLRPSLASSWQATMALCPGPTKIDSETSKSGSWLPT